MVNKAGTMFGDACWVLNHLCEAILGGDTLQLVLKLARPVQIDDKGGCHHHDGCDPSSLSDIQECRFRHSR